MHPDARLLDWLYGELAPPEHAQVTEHLRGCATCREARDSLAWVRTLVRDLPEDEPPAAISAHLLRAAARSALGASGARSTLGQRLRIWLAQMRQLAWAHPAVAAVASLVLVAGLTGILQVRGAPGRSEPDMAAPVRGAGAPADPGHAPVSPRREAAVVAQEAEREALAREPVPWRQEAAVVAQEAGSDVLAREPVSPRREAAAVARAGGSEGGESVRAKNAERKVARVSEGQASRSPVSPRADADVLAGVIAPAAGRAAGPAQDQVENLHARLRQALHGGACARAVGLAGELRQLDSGYYRLHVAGDQALAACARASAHGAGAGARDARARKARPAETADSPAGEGAGKDDPEAARPAAKE